MGRKASSTTEKETSSAIREKRAVRKGTNSCSSDILSRIFVPVKRKYD